jgi:hypothetical protein
MGNAAKKQATSEGSAELVKYEFEGDVLDVAPGDGEAHVVIRRVCEALGVSYQGQIGKLKTDPSICLKMILIQMPGDDQRREVACIDIRSVPLWLATIHPSKVKPEVRPKLVRYKTRCGEVLADHFLGPRRPARGNDEMWEMIGHLARVVGQEMVNVLAPVVGRMAEMEARSIERHDALLRHLAAERSTLDSILVRLVKIEQQPANDAPDHRFAREVCASLRRYGLLMAPEGDKAAAKSIRGKAETELRRQLSHTGKDSAWIHLRDPEKKAEARRLLRALLETAETVAEVRRPKQGKLFDGKHPPNPPPPFDGKPN